jgi:hypothetical protein
MKLEKLITQHFSSEWLSEIDGPTKAEFLIFYIYLQDVVLFSRETPDEKRREAYDIGLKSCIEQCHKSGDSRTIEVATNNRINDHYFKDFSERENREESSVVVGMKTLEHLCSKPSEDGKIVATRSNIYDLDFDFFKMMKIKAKIAAFAEASIGVINEVRKLL